MENPNYYAVIPANVRYDKDLKPMAKLLYGEIVALTQKDGTCWATNSYFAELYGLTTVTISNLIKDLVQKGYISSEIIYKEGTKEIDKRYLKIIEGGIKENLGTPIKENFKENNTSIEQDKKNKRNIKENEFSSCIHEIISYLNTQLGCSYLETTKDTRTKIIARLKEGFTVDNFKQVIDAKIAQWANSDTMRKYLRPFTLFGTKFEGYLQEARSQETQEFGFKIE